MSIIWPSLGPYALLVLIQHQPVHLNHLLLASAPSADACPSPSLSLQSIHSESDDIDYHLYLLINIINI